MAEPDVATTSLRSSGAVTPPLSDVVLDESLDLVPAGRPRRRRGRSAVLGALGVVGGSALIVVATLVTQDVSALIRVIVGVVGVFAVYLGIDALARLRFGDGFETGLWLSVMWVGLLAAAAIFADLLPLGEHENVSATISEPSLLRPSIFTEHPLGTDRQGLDILGGVIYGARVSLVVGLGAVLVGMVVGTTIGILAGYYRGRIDSGVSLLADSMLAFPPLILLLGMVAVLAPSVRNVTIALAILTIPTYIRLARANTMVFAQREFVLAARALGAQNRRIVLRELLPNVVLPVVSYAFIIVGALIVAESSLSFLGLGIQRPTPTWGNMIAAGQSEFDRHPHLVFIPGAFLFVTVFSLSLIGERARRAWDPRQGAV